MFPKRKAGIDSPVMCIIFKLSSEGALGLGKGCLDAGNRETGRALLFKKKLSENQSPLGSTVACATHIGMHSPGIVKLVMSVFSPLNRPKCLVITVQFLKDAISALSI